MYPRLSIDITWRDLARGARYCLWASGQTPPLSFPAADEAIVALSVRSAFDLLLAALKLPVGSEVMLSEVTVPHMPLIVQEHGLKPVAVPVEPRTLHVDVAEVERRLSSQTKVLVVAHLFGSRMPLDEIGQLCRERGVMLVEDCAQALASGQPQRHEAADVSLYSFGPIKTATALGGGIALVKQAGLREHMQKVAAAWPQQRTSEYAARLTKMAWLKLLSRPTLLSMLVWWLRRTGRDADAFVGHSARGFPDEHLFAHLRQQPCAALRQMIARRLSHFNQPSVERRTDRGQQLACVIAPATAAGCENDSHTWWVFPVVSQRPKEVVRELRSAGLDASQHSGVTVVGDSSPDHWFRRTVFVPHGDQVPKRMLDRAAEIIRQVES